MGGMPMFEVSGPFFVYLCLRGMLGAVADGNALVQLSNKVKRLDSGIWRVCPKKAFFLQSKPDICVFSLLHATMVALLVNSTAHGGSDLYSVTGFHASVKSKK